MIDLGTALGDPTPTILTLAEIGAAAVDFDLPAVLDVWPCDGTTSDDPTAVRRMATLARPEWLLAVRKRAAHPRTEAHIDRLCIAGDGESAVVATRRPDNVVLRDLPGDRSAPVLELLGDCPALQFDTANLETVTLAELVDSARSTSAAARRLTALRVEASAAEMLATALRHHESHTQIVGIAHGLQFDEHLTIFDAVGGRLLVTSSLAADGVRWSSVTSGTRSRIAQAVRSLVEGTRRFSPSGCPAPG